MQFTLLPSHILQLQWLQLLFLVQSMLLQILFQKYIYCCPMLMTNSWFVLQIGYLTISVHPVSSTLTLSCLTLHLTKNPRIMTSGLNIDKFGQKTSQALNTWILPKDAHPSANMYKAMGSAWQVVYSTKPKRFIVMKKLSCEISSPITNAKPYNEIYIC